MKYNNLLIESLDDCLLVRINRPDAMNALNATTMDELGQFFREGYRAFEFSGIILTGAGEKSFVAGADISQFLELDEEGATEMSRKGQNVFFSIENFARPVVAAVNGFALGGGCELAMACHLRVASENARFGQPEVNLGTIPGYGGTQRLIQYLGKGKAMELLLTGNMLNAGEAYALGLVNKVVPQADLIDSAAALIRKISTKGPIAVREVIQCVNAFFEEGTDGFSREVHAFGLAGSTSDFKEGARAFLEKRKPVFKGK